MCHESIMEHDLFKTRHYYYKGYLYFLCEIHAQGKKVNMAFFLLEKKHLSIFLHSLFDVSLPQPNRSFNSGIADYNVFCKVLFTDITQWQSFLRILFLCFKKPVIIAHTPLLKNAQLQQQLIYPR